MVCIKTKKCKIQSKCFNGATSTHCSRNPFLVFLAALRKKAKSQKDTFSAYESAVIAGSLWRRMSPDEKQPFIYMASKCKYVYKSRNRDVNSILQKLRCAVGAGKAAVDRDHLWDMTSKLYCWNRCIIESYK